MKLVTFKENHTMRTSGKNTVTDRGNPQSDRPLPAKQLSCHKVLTPLISMTFRSKGVAGWLIDTCGFCYSSVRYFALY